MKIDTTSFKVESGKKINLDDFTTKPTIEIEKEESLRFLDELKSELFELQEKLYADNRKSLLIIFQAMDAAGKDSVIKHVMSGLNPQGCQVFSFKQPTSEELDHDFLWRHYKALPERGRIGIHNRSHYENVLVCKVHPEFAANESKLDLSEIDNKFWQRRYHSIRNFEEHLHQNGTMVIKFFLYISKGEQKERFLKRIEDPHKNWKFSSGDIAEREKWKDYMHAYEDALTETSTQNAPWYIIPGDKKWFGRLAICQIIVDVFKSMNIDFPKLDSEGITSLEECKKQLLAEK